MWRPPPRKSRVLSTFTAAISDPRRDLNAPVTNRLRDLFVRFIMIRLRLIVLAFAYLSTVPTREDEQADAILEKAAAKARVTQTLSAEIEMSWQTPGQPLKRSIGSVKLMKPNYARISLRGDFPLHVLASDGTTVYAMPDASTYKEALANERGANIE
jgi:hypothetical protein